MKHIIVRDLEEESKQIRETLEGKNINFLFGAGASMPYLKTLEISNSKFTFEDIYNESTYTDYDEKTSDYLSAYFIKNSLSLGSYDTLEKTKDPICEDIKNHYIGFIECIFSILSRNSIQQPKRTNIFTTNYDMFFEYAFDQISRKNTQVNFNDGSYGFVHKTISTERFHTKIISVGVDSRFDYERPMFNLIKMHGSLNWRVDKEGLIYVDNDNTTLRMEFNKTQLGELIKLSEFAQKQSLEDIVNEIEDKIKSDFNGYYKRVNDLAIVKPTKRKFSETVFEEHHYQMLRILSQELERKQSVLIAFGFSFKDEHICSIVRRSLVNPNLLMYIVCFDDDAVDLFSDIFRDYQNVVLLSNGTCNKGRGDFTFLNSLLGGM